MKDSPPNREPSRAASTGPELSSRKWSEIALTVGDTVIPAALNDSRASRELIARLPYTVRLHKYDHDYCGVMGEPLPYDDEDLHNGWKNGDIAFAADGSYFAVLYRDEEISQQFGNLVTLGRINEAPSIMDTLDAEISVRIELRQQEQTQ